MKILIISEFFPSSKNLNFSGGVEARNFFIAKNLSKRNKITILTTRISGTKKEEKINGFSVVRAGPKVQYQAATGGILQRLLFVYHCYKAAKKIDIQIVEGTNFTTHFIAYIIGKNKNIPAVAWYPDVWIGSWIQNSGVAGILGEVLERINLKLGFNSFIAISSQTKEKLQKYVKKNIHLIPCGVDIGEFKKSAKKSGNTILCVSRLTKYKNVKELILAFALLSKENNKLILTIVGRGPEEKNLKELVKEIKLNKKVIFKSNLKRKDLIKLYDKSFLFCLPSKVEGFGISVIESAAAQTPYVITNIPVFKEITKNFKGGSLYVPGDVYDLSAKLKLLLSNSDLYQKKRNECKKLAKSYKWENIAKQTEEIYRSVI